MRLGFVDRILVSLMMGGLIAVFVLVIALTQAHARDSDGRYANSPLHEWYESQHNSLGQWCCNDADGHPYFGDYRINEDGSVTAEGETIPAEKVLKGANPTGHAVWWYVDTAYGRTTWCFIPGSMT